MKELIEKLKAENAELKAQLARAIVPKYKVGQEVWGIMEADEFGTMPYRDVIKDVSYTYELEDDQQWNSYFDEELFATEAEALKSLENKDE